jgi:hypothetical protein
MTLEGETNDCIINRSWADYLRECINLHFLRLDNVNIGLNIWKLTKLEVLFMKLKPVNDLGLSIVSPSSMKAIVVSASEESDTQSSKQRMVNLSLGAPEGTRLDIL